MANSPMGVGGDPNLKQLVDEACQAHSAGDSGKYKRADDRFVTVMTKLAPYGADAAKAAEALFQGGNVAERCTAVDMLGLLVESSKEVHDICFYLLVNALTQELEGVGNADVVSLVASAFGCLYDVRAVPLLVELATHESKEVRFAVAAAIPSACKWGALPEAVGALVCLSSDADEDVRDWACFGLGQLHADSAQVRDALAIRLSDPHGDTRAEAPCSVGATRR